ncbi:hypothetical protein PsorP6_017260 [Peronosclerospora sorghi]|uniref:Uncharacterized protein n=1 Tax=Peronosclerospora sorghi TaxID=230839 RepID=A0ACC0WKC3_9STRA|nr:hypothetical protein PsorP6_017260 [Peronosclerospora sorghi]
MMINKRVDAKSPPRKSRLKYDFPIETLEKLSHFRQDEAAKILGVASITLKRNCQRHKYRWPYRSIKAKHRREARLAAQKVYADKAFGTPSPELLLALRKAPSIHGLATSVSNLDISTPMMCATKSHSPPTHEAKTSKHPPQLPPLTWVLQSLQVRSPPATPPRLKTMRPMHHHPLEHKNSFYSANVHTAAPKFSLGCLSALGDEYPKEPRTSTMD